ncbi:MAG TPA: hypothetical protein VNP93_02720 [Gaiellaceae bacterium]|nr:hypothetical protein [Gaiellaceae bacterium]
MRRWATFFVSLPERAARALVGALGGAVHETAEVLLPRFARRSRLYEATAKNLLRIAIELVGAVERPQEEDAPEADELAKRKAAGNVVELGSIAAFGFSPLWLLAAAADVLHGSRVYLDALTAELKRTGVLEEGAEIATVDDLLGALEGASGTTARLVDIPPLELAALRRSLADLRRNAGELPGPGDLAALYEGLRRTAARERRPLLEVSAGMGLAFLVAARDVGRAHVIAPYAEDWQPLRAEGFGAYARRVARPYGAAMSGHFDPGSTSWTERGATQLRRATRRWRSPRSRTR